MPREMYLDDIPLAEAQSRFWAALNTVGGAAPLPADDTAVPVPAALGRVTAQAVFARLSVPHYPASAMDGIAVRARETLGATETAPVCLTVGSQAVWVDTGDPLPAEMDAVVMAEQVQELANGETVELLAAVAPWQHVRPMGEDMVATELVVPANHLLTPVDLGALTAAGHTAVLVRRQPRIALVPTGSELIRLSEGVTPAPGEIVDFNSVMLAGQVQEWGGIPTRFPPVRDDRQALCRCVREALETHDVVVVNAGSSAGSEDFTAAVIREFGEVLVHGVAIRPGHPVILGVSHTGKPILGLPGYPVSTILTSELFLMPLVYHLRGLTPPEVPTCQAIVTRKLLSPMGEDEMVRVKLGQVGPRMVATPLSRGAGVISSMVKADGVTWIPRFSEGVHAGTEIEVRLLRRPDEIRKTVVAIGSHDLALDVLSNALSLREPGASLASSNVGSLGGLLALARDEAHLAGSHLLDEETGVYNVSAIERYLPGKRVVLVTLAGRVQGLLVPPGNPKDVRSLADLARVSFVNRQRGSGTRVLLDYKLRHAGIDPQTIAGYEREAYTHLAIAADVASGAADTGLGILAAARALELDFIPLFDERYDLVIPREHYQSDLLAPLLDILRGGEFRREVERLGGYDISHMGTVAWES